jgi:imidazolonepropionase-like amidohydrolase
MVAALHREGAGVLLGSDAGNPLVIPGHSLRQGLALLVEAGLRPFDALAAGTRDAATFMGAQAEWGTIAVGRVADLILLGANPLVDVAAARSPVGVAVKGRWYPATSLAQMVEEAGRR